MSTTVNFKPKQVTKSLIGALSPRSRDVMIKRYGLSKDSEPMTLDAIGKIYGITRERVRQIENHALTVIRKSKEYTDQKSAFDEIEGIIHTLGGIVVEKDLLDYISSDRSIQSHINFILVVAHPFNKIKEDDDFKHRWFIDKDLSEKVHGALKKLYATLKSEDLLSEPDIIKSFLNQIEDLSEKYKNDEIARRWLGLSKKIGKNTLGEWGKTDSSNISTKGMRDYAYLIIRRHGSPIHFREVVKIITEVFKIKAHVATCHNELIKDPRFVLVGRGLYALSEWGYMSGVVKEVIKKVLEKNGPLTKSEVIEKVLKERYVKENTIIINLQNPKFFKKNKEGKYEIVKPQ